MKRVVFSILGSKLDSDQSEQRWQGWRPNVALTQSSDMPVDRLELIHLSKDKELAHFVKKDIEDTAPTKVSLHSLDLNDPWDFQKTYRVLLDLCDSYRFSSDITYYVHLSTGTHTMQICLFLLTETHYFPAFLLQSAPPINPEDTQSRLTTIDLELSKYSELAARFNRRKNQHVSYLKAGIETQNVRYNALIDEMEYVSLNSKSPMLISGPTGAGKTQLAKRIYELKKQQQQLLGPLVELNCSTLTKETALSMIFGHTRGAFTGAQTERKGLLRTAHQGLLFLDEIGELGLDEQTLLLKAIEEKRFMPLGSDKYVQSDFQLIAGTNRDLWQEVKAKRFREDLLARIDLWAFELPGLKDRLEDLEPNIQFELERQGVLRGKNIKFTREGKQKYMTFALSESATWNANFRDLASSIERLATLASGGLIEERHVQREIDRLK
ncbi:MAG: RNA repair transcriptional activator RtcR family protein, partial [Pseudomonadales bacterium]|nr:RNA repair transcriptional activator RtcR family protein [Pseudomonadales bacterium]